ncbi:hypothetical protein [Streptomyces sp. MMG1121]|uniref:hypothetical protein n=1 Tax=Streptomyces sp. MMG1121 TaxID=1415544 RepID=UPI000A442898|nr:hypothetical protein [Streptomyces sp. MMG1121]
MSFMFGRRTATVATAAALSVGALITATGSASADDTVPISVGHYVGLYNHSNTTDGKLYINGQQVSDVPPGGAIVAQCWTVGQSIGTYGDTWYRTNEVDWPDGLGWRTGLPTVYVFAGYADGNARSVNRDPNIPQC